MKNDDWMSQGACVGQDGKTRDAEGNVKKDTHFPVSRRKQKMAEPFDPETQVTDPVAAKKLCRICPVTEECLDYMLSLKEVPDGVWAGMTKREARKYKRQQERAS